MPAAQNLIVIMSDEHNPKVMGCNGHGIVKTPNIDALAAKGATTQRVLWASTSTKNPKLRDVLIELFINLATT